MNNFFIFNEGTRVSESEIYKLAQKINGLVKNTAVLDKPIAYEVAVAPTELKTRTPEKHGGWDGERGNSVWHPDPDYIPPEKSKNPEDKPYSNPGNLSWEELLSKYELTGIEFRDGLPVLMRFPEELLKLMILKLAGMTQKIVILQEQIFRWQKKEDVLQKK